MSPVLVDSNLLIDIFSDNPEWADWSRNQLTLLSRKTVLYINPVIYTEISTGFERIEELDKVLSSLPIRFEEIPREALFLTGKAFLKYRRKGGVKTSPLPVFYIGAHGAVNKWAVITRDPKRMTYYYPLLDVISP